MLIHIWLLGQHGKIGLRALSLAVEGHLTDTGHVQNLRAVLGRNPSQKYARKQLVNSTQVHNGTRHLPLLRIASGVSNGALGRRRNAPEHVVVVSLPSTGTVSPPPAASKGNTNITFPATRSPAKLMGHSTARSLLQMKPSSTLVKRTTRELIILHEL